MEFLQHDAPQLSQISKAFWVLPKNTTKCKARWSEQERTLDVSSLLVLAGFFACSNSDSSACLLGFWSSSQKTDADIEQRTDFVFFHLCGHLRRGLILSLGIICGLKALTWRPHGWRACLPF